MKDGDLFCTHPAAVHSDCGSGQVDGEAADQRAPDQRAGRHAADLEPCVRPDAGHGQAARRRPGPDLGARDLRDLRLGPDGEERLFPADDLRPPHHRDLQRRGPAAGDAPPAHDDGGSVRAAAPEGCVQHPGRRLRDRRDQRQAERDQKTGQRAAHRGHAQRRAAGYRP